MVKNVKSKSTKNINQSLDKDQTIDANLDNMVDKSAPVLNLKKIEIDKVGDTKIEPSKNKISYKWIVIVGVLNLLIIALIVGFFVFEKRKDSAKTNSPTTSSNSQESSSSSQSSKTEISSNSSSQQSISQASSSQSVEASSSSSAGPVAISYTNPYYPDLRINYDSSWAFSTTTNKSNYTGVLNRQLLFIKNGVTFEVGIYPVFATGCGGPDRPQKMVETKVDTKLSRYKSNYKTDSYYYLNPGGNGDEDCAFFGMGYINSNVVSKEFTAAMNSKYVYSFINMNVTGTDQNTIKEVDKIVLNSKFISKPR